jgi:GH15 family glucan-1,4-alpha-glucosidase
VSGSRTDGYAPIRDYALLGDGRTAALVARDGSIDWLCLPNFDSPAVFAAILDAARGGSFSLAPAGPFESERGYHDGTNVLETTFRTPSGVVHVRDAMTIAAGEELVPLRELVREARCLAGRIRLEWRLEPRFEYGSGSARVRRGRGRVIATSGAHAVAVSAWGPDGTALFGDGAGGSIELEAGESALFSLSGAHKEPLVLAGREDTQRRLERTARFWRGWSARARYEGPYRDAVLRSALVLKLLIFAPSGAIVAAPTTSLPEWIRGSRNWDYRYTWLRDAAYTLEALLGLGYDEEAHAFFWWLMHASRLTRPELAVLYGVDGSRGRDEAELGALSGYRDSAPVRVGNAAVHQRQLDVYGAVLNAIWLHVEAHGRLEAETGRAVARLADHVAEIWRQPDSGIWEVRSEPVHFIQSKAMCWAALDRAAKLAERGVLPERSARWRGEAERIRRFIDEHGWDERRRSFVRARELRELDASLLTLVLIGYDDPRGDRLLSTVEAVRRELAHGPLVDRYRGVDGVPGDEGAFLTCSFWLADALARSDRVDEASELMDELLRLANDVGLYAEELEPASGDFLGNFPQALVHLALVNAALSIERAAA